MLQNRQPYLRLILYCLFALPHAWRILITVHLILRGFTKFGSIFQFWLKSDTTITGNLHVLQGRYPHCRQWKLREDCRARTSLRTSETEDKFSQQSVTNPDAAITWHMHVAHRLHVPYITCDASQAKWMTASGRSHVPLLHATMQTHYSDDRGTVPP
jgi:hypothetical protein